MDFKNFTITKQILILIFPASLGLIGSLFGLIGAIILKIMDGFQNILA